MEIVLNQFMACNIQAVNCSLQVKTLQIGCYYSLVQFNELNTD